MHPSATPPPAPADAATLDQRHSTPSTTRRRRRRPRAGVGAALSSLVAAVAVLALSRQPCPGRAFLMPPPAPGCSGPSSPAGGLITGGEGRLRRPGATPASPTTARFYSLRERGSSSTSGGGAGGGAGGRGGSSSSSRGCGVDEVEALLDEVERMQTRAFKEVGLLGRPFPIAALERLKGEGRLGTAPERDALSRAREVVGDREGQGAMLEALRLRAMAKRLRAEADLAEVELANEKARVVCVVCFSFGGIMGETKRWLASHLNSTHHPPFFLLPGERHDARGAAGAGRGHGAAQQAALRGARGPGLARGGPRRGAAGA